MRYCHARFFAKQSQFGCAQVFRFSGVQDAFLRNEANSGVPRCAGVQVFGPSGIQDCVFAKRSQFGYLPEWSSTKDTKVHETRIVIAVRICICSVSEDISFYDDGRWSKVSSIVEYILLSFRWPDLEVMSCRAAISAYGLAFWRAAPGSSRGLSFFRECRIVQA